MNTITQRPAHVPAPIAKVDGDTQVMQWEYLARTGQSEIDQLARFYVFLNHKQAKLVLIDDKTSTAATKAQKWITAIEGKIADAEVSILRYFEYMEETAILADCPQVAEAAPVCGTCGGEGNCPDCMVWDAPLTEVLVDLHTDGMTDTDTYASVEAAILADYPVAVVAQTDIVTRLESRYASSTSYEDSLSDADEDLLLDAADEIRRLKDIITGLQSDLHACERSRTATDEAFAGHVEAATAEAEQLRGELFKERGSHAETTKALRDLLAGRPITSVQYDADYEPSPWVWRVRTMQQVSWHNAKTQEKAIKDAQAVSDGIIRQLERGY